MPEPSTAPAPGRRVSGLVAAILIAVAAASGFLAGGEAVERRFARQRMSAELVELAHQGGIRDASGDVLLSTPLPVGVAQSGGPLWVTEELTAAVEADEALRIEEGAHRVMAEVVGASPAIALRLSLERQGWLLRTPRPLRLRTAPWVAVLSAILGVFTLRFIRRLGAALAVAGLLAQGTVALLPWPPVLASRGLVDSWSSGPLGIGLRRFAVSLPDEAFAIGLGVVVMCTILVAFDHRRSRNRGGNLLLWGALGLVGAIAWVEAAVRVGGAAALPTMPGLVAAVGLVALYVAGWRRFVSKQGDAR